MSTISDLAKVVIEYVKKSSKLRSISVSDIRSIIDLNISVHDTIIAIEDTHTSKELLEMYNRYIKHAVMSNCISRNIPIDLHKKYGNAAKSKVSSSGYPLAAIFAANRRFRKILSEISKNLDNVMVDKSIYIFNARLSHVALLGILRQSEMYGTYLSYLWTQMVSTITNSKGLIPKYRSEYLINNNEMFTRVTNLICEKEGRYTFLAEMENIKKKNANLILYANGQAFDTFANVSAYNASVISYLSSGIAALNVFAWVGELFDNYKHNRYLKNKGIKEWMESHSAILKLELSSADKNSPEYRKLESIIVAYDDMISEYDRKINDYLEED